MVQLKFEEATAGVLDTSSRDSAVEYAEVIAKGESEATNVVQPGDHVFVKAWAVDIVDHEGKKFYFCDITSNGILAVVK